MLSAQFKNKTIIHLQDVDDAHKVNLIGAARCRDAAIVGLEHRTHIYGQMIQEINENIENNKETIVTDKH